MLALFFVFSCSLILTTLAKAIYQNKCQLLNFTQYDEKRFKLQKLSYEWNLCLSFTLFFNFLVLAYCNYRTCWGYLFKLCITRTPASDLTKDIFVTARLRFGTKIISSHQARFKTNQRWKCVRLLLDVWIGGTHRFTPCLKNVHCLIQKRMEFSSGSCTEPRG